jgi:hypothetical protein
MPFTRRRRRVAGSKEKQAEALVRRELRAERSGQQDTVHADFPCRRSLHEAGRAATSHAHGRPAESERRGQEEGLSAERTTARRGRCCPQWRGRSGGRARSRQRAAGASSSPSWKGCVFMTWVALAALAARQRMASDAVG